MALNAAVFIDKDGTLIDDVPYNVDPTKVRLCEGAGEALARLQRHGYRLILVTNQPGVALGLFEPDALEAVWAAIAALLSPYGVVLDAIYHCPHHPQGTDTRFASRCECRKPEPGLLLQAAEDHRLDLQRSWLIGDILDDIEAGRRAGCRTVLLAVGSETEWRRGPMREPDLVASSLVEAVDGILDWTPAEASHRIATEPESGFTVWQTDEPEWTR
ncbi:D-glycero-alpha-D-manno-heptose-1,7-bisphosphate 7-phosphatase [Aromatoleum buckelii]|uniref:D,D-heptose 1,7-bisphosphate phosphatase n=1 Tax=Aromatoleum buckelii TaxID=200254 RepID=A0ABX1N0M3_9RHOO|nr:HAD family hydrolase [Aromatoleum buckelii]MCK0512641.1 HAD family hydrolase [Aromatoleum buckelii]